MGSVLAIVPAGVHQNPTARCATSVRDTLDVIAVFVLLRLGVRDDCVTRDRISHITDQSATALASPRLTEVFPPHVLSIRHCCQM